MTPVFPHTSVLDGLLLLRKLFKLMRIFYNDNRVKQNIYFLQAFLKVNNTI